jgi:hypothetical protein
VDLNPDKAPELWSKVMILEKVLLSTQAILLNAS